MEHGSRLNRGVLRGVVSSFVLCASAEAAIENFGFADTRGMALGGAVSASVDDAAAGFINPAALGFMARQSEGDVDNNGLGEQTFGWNLVDVGAGATLTGELGDYLQVLADVDFSRFQPPELQNPGNIADLIELAGTLGNVSDEDTIMVSATAGTMMQIGHFGVGIRSFGQVGGWINNLDLINLGLLAGVDQIADDLRQAMADDGFDPTGYDPQILNSESIQKLRDAFGGATANDDVLAYIDYKTVELIEQNELDADKIKGAVDALAEIIVASGAGNSLEDNQTSITGRGFLAVEVPVSYGYAVNDNLSLGGQGHVWAGLWHPGLGIQRRQHRHYPGYAEYLQRQRHAGARPRRDVPNPEVPVCARRAQPEQPAFRWLRPNRYTERGSSGGTRAGCGARSAGHARRGLVSFQAPHAGIGLRIA